MTVSGKLALSELGLDQSQVRCLEDGKSVAFVLSDAAQDTIAVARLDGDHLQLGIYTIHNIGGGIRDFKSFERRARSVARRVDARTLEIMGIEPTNPKLERILIRKQFRPSTLPVPVELGGGTFNVLSRIEPVEADE